MLNFAQAVRSVRKAEYDPAKERSTFGNPGLTGSVMNVKAATEIMARLLADKMRLDPSTNAIQFVNSLATSSQWSPEVGRAAAAKVLEQARRAGGGYSPGFSGPQRGIDKRAAIDVINERAAAIRGSSPHLTEAQAFEKAYEGDRALRAKHHAERVAKFGWGLNADGRMRVGENVA
jgi:hypothetical protein